MKEFRVYKPRKDSSGNALKLQCVNKPRKGKTVSEHMLFLEIAAQSPNKDEHGNDRFDWSAPNKTSQSLQMKLGPVDVAEILLVLHGYRQEAKLYHKKDEQSGIALSVRKNDDKGMLFRLSTSKENYYQILLSPNELIQLRLLLERFTLLYYGWV